MDASMGRLLIFTVAMLAAAGGGPAPAAAQLVPSKGPGPLKVVAFGDSLTSGHRLGARDAYPAVLERTLRDAGYPVAVVNHGVSGDTTSRALRRLEAALD